jgi:hypothetical protein
MAKKKSIYDSNLLAALPFLAFVGFVGYKWYTSNSSATAPSGTPQPTTNAGTGQATGTLSNGQAVTFPLAPTAGPQTPQSYDPDAWNSSIQQELNTAGTTLNQAVEAAAAAWDVAVPAGY